jgi:pyridoxamine 5'-phosphate oxidase
MLNLKALRKDYRQQSLDLTDLNDHPFIQFQQWFQDALKAEIPEPNAMSLATATPQGIPSCRMVLLKELDDRGFVFYTNVKSRKGKDLEENPFACATFYWFALERQVIIQGSTEQVSQQEVESYFASRPRESQISAWASHQSEPIPSREELEKMYLTYEKKFEKVPVPLPPYWGGYRILPTRIEFWQGRNRLHDRFCYYLIDHQWHIERLSP